MAPSSRWNLAIVSRVQFRSPVEAGRAIIGEQLAGIMGVHAVGEGSRLLEVRMDGFAPDQVGVCREREPAGDAMVEAASLLEAEEAFGRALAGDELAIALVDIAGHQLRALGIGAGDDDGRNTASRPQPGARRRDCGCAAAVGIRTLPPRCPHFFSDASWSSK